MTGVLDNLPVGFAATLGTIVIHGFMLHTVIIALQRNLQRGRLGPGLRMNLTFIGSATLFMLVAISLEVALWALVLELCGAFADFATAVYCSAGSYTTLGSAGAALPPEWKLLGPMEAASGMLMFGISTALIFAIVQSLIQARLEHSG